MKFSPHLSANGPTPDRVFARRVSKHVRRGPTSLPKPRLGHSSSTHSPGATSPRVAFCILAPTRQDANLCQANLQHSNLHDANLQNAKLGGANLKRQIWSARICKVPISRRSPTANQHRHAASPRANSHTSCSTTQHNCRPAYERNSPTTYGNSSTSPSSITTTYCLAHLEARSRESRLDHLKAFGHTVDARYSQDIQTASITD